MTAQRNKLEFQADRIESLLALHNVTVRVEGGTVTPRWVRFQVLPAVGVKISKIKGLHEELAAALDAPSCRVSRRGAAVAVEVPRDNPQPVRLLPLYRQLTDQPLISNSQSSIVNRQSSIPPVAAILGLAEDGAPLLVRLPSPDVAHILVAGTTGSGKTVLLQTMILSLAMVNTPQALDLVLVDPKGHAFSLFEGLPHLARPVIREMEETIEALHSLMHLMERRNNPNPRVLLFIDELADLLMVGGQPVQWALTRLTQRGRNAGIHVIAATQKPTAAVLGPLIKANFPVRLVGRVTSADDARTATGWSGTGAERLTGRGDFLAIAEGRVIRFQAAHASPDEIREVVAGIPGSAEVAVSFTDELGTFILPRLTEVFTSPRQSTIVNRPSNGELAHLLVDSKLWPDRHHPDRVGDYRWGWLSEVSRLLFDHALEGTWDRQTRQVIAQAEQISTTTHDTPQAGPRGGAIPPRE